MLGRCGFAWRQGLTGRLDANNGAWIRLNLFADLEAELHAFADRHF
jgi:hypothetical protein